MKTPGCWCNLPSHTLLVSISCSKGAIIFYRNGGLFVCGGGGQNFLGWSEGGTKIFLKDKRGAKIYFSRGGPIFLHLRRNSLLLINFPTIYTCLSLNINLWLLYSGEVYHYTQTTSVLCQVLEATPFAPLAHFLTSYKLQNFKNMFLDLHASNNSNCYKRDNFRSLVEGFFKTEPISGIRLDEWFYHSNIASWWSSSKTKTYYDVPERVWTSQDRFPSIFRELSFFTGRGGRLSMITGRQFFLVPPFAYEKKFWSPPLPREKILVPPQVKEHRHHTTNGKGSD